MLNKLSKTAMAAFVIIGLLASASIACPCTNDTSPCKCGSSCSCHGK